MSDDFEAFATAGSGKSEAEVAFDLLNKLKGQGVWGERNKSDILDMYAECLDAARGLRVYEGQRRVDAPILTAGASSQAARPAAPQMQAQPAPAPMPAPPMPAPQAELQAAPQPRQQAANPVQVQQHQIQQQIQNRS